VKNAAVFIIGLTVALVVMQLIKGSQYRRYAWLYVAILLMGMAVFNRPGIMAFASDLQNKLKGG
jgi:hypothetical protein